MVEDVVLLHGFGGTRGAWAAVEKLLPPPRYRPLALDLPGHGDLADVRPPITFAKCVASVLERSPKRFVLGGYSMGGRIALNIALQAPQRVERLVLVSATAGIQDPTERAARRRSDRRFAKEIAQGSIEEFIERWRSKPMFAEDPPEVDALARADQALNGPRGVAAALRGIGAGEMPPLWEKLAELEMPVIVVAGHRDRKFVRTGERMVKLLPDSLLKVTGGGHCLLFENPKNVAMALA
ncbi:MAG TPA: alpha/beta fold hydrolase [Solirubrobacteraceae bacterium]